MMAPAAAPSADTAMVSLQPGIPLIIQQAELKLQ